MAKDCTEQIERSRKRLAKCLNLLEAVTDELEYVFEVNREWNSEIKYQIGDAAEKLGRRFKGTEQLAYAEKIGLGSRKYELITPEG